MLNPEQPLIRFDQVSKQYSAGRIAINNLSFTINKGELVFLAGPSGAGKSTILKLIAGIEIANTGKVIINDLNLNQISKTQRTFIRQHLGIIFQDHKILYDRSVFDNVRLGLDITGLYSPTQTHERITHALNAVGLEDKAGAHPQQLSGGEQQRLCIARAVVHQPKILLADEPTANLDRDNALKILELFKAFHKAGVTIIMSAHDETILNDYGKRILYLSNGQFRG